ncbi:MAG: hypothetical protein IMZ62_06615 [Chloroflexi bacterium]|nr:hypothetical protein [Chloroflexota bacterium]
MSQDAWERTYGAHMREVCESINELLDRLYDGEAILPAILKVAADGLTELESDYHTITGSDDRPDEMVVARMHLTEIQEELGDTGE